MAEPTLIHGLPADYWHETKAPTLIGSCTFFIVLTIATISLRFYARHFAGAPLWWDDWFALATVPFALLAPIIDIVQLRDGFGRHQIVTETEAPWRLERYNFFLYLVVLFYNPGIALFKYSFLALYLRLFPVIGWMKWSCYTLAGLVTMWVVANEFALIFRCSPIEGSWKMLPESHCIEYLTIFLSQSVPTIIFDIVILFLPVRLVWGIQMPRTQRIGVIGVFLLGAIVTIISIVRLSQLITAPATDLTWNWVEIGLWSAGEPVTGLVCCCLPTYAPLMRAMTKKMGLDSSQAGKSSKGNTKLTGNGTLNTAKHEDASDGIRVTRTHYVGYERSEEDSDTFQLTDMGDGRIVKQPPV